MDMTRLVSLKDAAYCRSNMQELDPSICSKDNNTRKSWDQTSFLVIFAETHTEFKGTAYHMAGNESFKWKRSIGREN